MNRQRMLNRLAALMLMGGILLQPAAAQYAEDVLRFSQFGLGVGARWLGMGNAAVGSADDYSALFWNPAGLASMRNFEFSAGVSTLSFGNKAGFFGSSTSSQLRATNLNNLGIVYPVPTSRGALTFAFGFGRTAGYHSTLEFDGFNASSSLVRSLAPTTDLLTMSLEDALDFINDNIPFQIYLADTLDDYLFPVLTDSLQQSALVTEGGGMNSWSLGGAIDIARDLSLGISLNLMSGSYAYDREYTETDIRNVYHSLYAFPYNFDRFVYTSTIKSDLTGFNALFGLMYRKQGLLKIGATVRTPTLYEISEVYTDQGQSSFDDGTRYTSDLFQGKTVYRIVTPMVVALGGSLQLTDWLLLAGDAELTDWTQMEFDSELGDLLAENRVIQKIFRATANLRGGAEVTLWNLGVRLRGGFVLNPSPYKGDPAGYDQRFLTLGAGFQLDENVLLNAGYAYGMWKTHRDNYYLEGISGSRVNESVTTHHLNLTFSYRF